MPREVLKNNKGFTIMELLSVIAILLLIMAIAMPSITSLLGRTNEKISKEKEKAFISAAQNYINDNYNSVNLDSNKKCYVELSTLNSKGYLSENSYKDTDGNPYSGYVTYEYKNGINDKYEYGKTSSLKCLNS